jgi:hypothetical protein
MKRFNPVSHAIVASSISAIAISISLAANSAGQAMTGVMQNAANGTSFDFNQLFTDAIDNVGQARAAIERTLTELQDKDDGVIEAKDVDHVIAELVANDYLKTDSQAIAMILTQDIDAALSHLDDKASAVIDNITWARDSISVDNTDSYLGYTVPVQNSVDDMKSLAQDLQIIVSATWRDHNDQPSFVVATTGPLTEAKVAVAA